MNPEIKQYQASSSDERAQLNPQQLRALSNIDRIATRDESVLSHVMDITGVIAGIKPCSIIDYDPEVAQSITALGLERHDMHENNVMTVSRSKALSGELAEALTDLWTRPKETDIIHRRIGEFLGYPGTSTEYFIKRRLTLNDPVDQQLPMIHPRELQGTPARRFAQFVLSPEHWREELDSYAVPMELATRYLTPLSYKKFERQARRERVDAGLLRLLGKQPPLPWSGNIAVQVVTR